MNKVSFRTLRPILLALLLVPMLARICPGASLYQRSQALFEAAADKASPHDYTFVILGDSRGGDPIFRKLLQLARSYRPLFILHGGDYSNRGGDAETRHFLSLVNAAVPEIPLFVVKGNHEARETFAREIGPSHFTLTNKRLGLTLVALDNSENKLKAQELEYLETSLATGAATRLVAMHVPPMTERWNWHAFSDGADALKKILMTQRVQGVFFSHVHLYDRAEFGGVPAIITGGAGAPLVTFGFPGDPVYHFVVVRVKDGKASYLKVPLEH